MRVSTIRSGRICRLALCLLVLLPLLYLLANWSDHHKRVQEAYHTRFGGPKFAHQRLERLCKEAIVCGMYTVDSAHLENRYVHGEQLPGVKINYTVRMEKIGGCLTLNGLPLAFGNGGAKLVNK